MGGDELKTRWVDRLLKLSNSFEIRVSGYAGDAWHSISLHQHSRNEEEIKNE